MRNPSGKHKVMDSDPDRDHWWC